MSEPFIAEIRIFAGNFAPRTWALCDGQLLPIAQNTALFSLIGTTYGGNGTTTTGLPDLRDRVPMHPGTGPGLSSRALGQQVGSETAALTANQMPQHTHTQRASTRRARDEYPSSGVSFAEAGETAYAPAGSPTTEMAAVVASQGSGVPHENRQPYLALTFIIALQGLYPSRS